MKKYSLFLPMFLFALVGITGCELVGDIFRAGVWVGIVLVIGVVLLVIALLRKLF